MATDPNSNPCNQEIDGLPKLTGCPADTEYFLVMGAAGGKGSGGYGLRAWGDIQTCLRNSLVFVNQLYVVPRDMAAGLDTLLITQANVIPDSGFITFGGTELPPDDATPIISGQLDCTITYPAGGIQFAFNQQMQDNNWFIIHFAYFQ